MYTNSHKKSKKPASSISEFAKKPIVIIITLLITLSGGIPGILSTFSYFYKKPKIIYNLGLCNYGDGKFNHKEPIGVFLVSMDVSNVGEKPLIPKAYIASIKYDDKEVELFPIQASETITAFSSNNDTLTYHDGKAKDLQNLSVIAPDQSITGLLEFFTYPLVMREFMNANKKQIKIVCIDVYGQKYSTQYYELNHPMSFDKTHPMVFPKEGITVDK